MEKIFGTTVRQDGLQRIGRSAWVLFYGLYQTEDGSSYEFRHTFTHRPTEDEIKAIIIEQINAETDAKILNGYRWHGMAVWLSTENQFNFKAAYDMAAMSNGAILPVEFKLGEKEDGTPVYHEFTNMEEFTDFYSGALQHVTNTLKDGWIEKDSLDMSKFVCDE